jgi:multimeric flavodoxin WrbA
MNNTKIRLPFYLEKKAAEKKTKILVFSGSSRSAKNCGGGDGKTLELAKIAIESLPKDVEAELINLAVEDDELIIRPCKACVSTAGGYHCHFPCSCYQKAEKENDVKDLMYEKDIYKKLQECDGFIVYTPIHWYSVSTPVKAMFDRLVCMSATLPAEFAMKELGKDPKKTIPAYKEGIYDDKLKNWLEGKYAAFFIHGDDGGDDSQRLNAPKSFNKEYDKLANDPDVAIMPIVATCRYSGIFVPDDLIFGTLINKGLNYAEANEKFKEDQEQIKEKAKDLINKLASYLKK